MPLVNIAGRGSRLFTSGGGGGGSFVPDVIKYFQGTNGVGMGSVGLGADGGIFSSYSGGYGSYFTNAQSRSAHGTSLAMKVASGSTGDPTDGGTGGLFGISWGLPSNLYCAQGDSLHYGAWMYFPSNWDFGTNSGYLKFLRIGATGTGQKIDNLIAGGSTHYGWGFSVEWDQSQFANSIKDVTVVIPKAQWVWIEQAFTFNSNGTLGARRVWINGQLSMEIVGTAVRWIDTTTQTATLGGAIPTLPASNSEHHDGAWFTYFNGGASQDQECYLDVMVIHKNVATLPDTDSFGNKMLGLTYANTI